MPFPPQLVHVQAFARSFQAVQLLLGHNYIRFCEHLRVHRKEIRVQGLAVCSTFRHRSRRKCAAWAFLLQKSAGQDIQSSGFHVLKGL